MAGAGAIVLLAILRYEMLGGFRAFDAIVVTALLSWYLIFRTDLLVIRRREADEKLKPPRRRATSGRQSHRGARKRKRRHRR